MYRRTIAVLVLSLFIPSLLYAQQNKLFSEAYSLMQKSLFEEAVVKLKESLKANPNHAPSNSNLALCLEKLHQYDAAVQVWRRYERISQSSGGKIQQHIMLIGKMKEIFPNLTKGNPAPVMGTISQILKDPYPESIIKLDCATYLAHYYYIKKQYPESLSLYSQAIRQYRNYFVDEEALYEYAQLLSKEKKDYLSAAKIYKDILIRPKRKKADVVDLLAECYKNKAEVYEKEGKERESRLMYERILIEVPTSKHAEVARSKVGDIVKSVARRRETADAYFSEGQYAQALKIYKELAVESKEKELIAYAQFQLARALASTGDYGGAVKAYHNVVRNCPDSNYADDSLIEAGCLLGGTLKKPEYAIKEFQLVLKKYRRGDMCDDALYYIGYTFLRRFNNKRQAVSYFRKLIKKYPDSPWVQPAKERIRELKRER